MHGRVLPLCPEQLGGLPTPRSPARITGGNGDEVLAGKAEVLGPAGEAMSAAFLLGASRTLTLASRYGCREAVLKERSPSCGVSRLSNPEGSREGRERAAGRGRRSERGGGGRSRGGRAREEQRE